MRAIRMYYIHVRVRQRIHLISFQKGTISIDKDNVAFGKLINICTPKYIMFNQNALRI